VHDDGIKEMTKTVENIRAVIAARAHDQRHYLEDARSHRTLTYAQLAKASGTWKALFVRLDVQPGMALVVDITDTLAFSVVELSALAYGLRVIPVDPHAPWSDVARMSELIQGAALIVSTRRDRGIVPGATILSVNVNTFRPSEAPKEAIRTATRSTATGSGSIIMFTSGSTGTPKGVELPEAQLLYVATQIARHNKLTETDRGYNSLPLFHINAQVVGILATLIAGSTLVLDERFHRTGFWELLDDRRITWMNGAPAILSILARSGEQKIPSTLRFIRSASAPLPDIIRDAFKGVELLVSYGMTEGASQITATPLGAPARPGSVGLPVGNALEVRDDSGVPLPVGEVGMVWIRGKGVITQYLHGRAAERFDANGWLQTGDLGRVDEDGYVYLMGRSDDLIIRGGENLYPAEIENVLLEDDAVREAVVAARDDEVLGQVPVAYVIPVDAELTDAQKNELVATLQELCEAKLTKYKRPAEVNVVDDLPRAATGKFQRVKIREKARET
jgi:acyl-CoA synthetase (AMP-forming)/AMP-acid ligase II